VASPCANPSDWRLSLPLTTASGCAEVRALSEALLGTLGLEGDVAIIEGGVETAMHVEAHFRRRWWAGLADPFREAVHKCKLRAHAGQTPSAVTTAAWRQMSERVHSGTWREQVRRLTRARSPAQAAGLRLLFGAAAQVWTRAARWEASLGPLPNPFVRIVRLLERGCWPVGSDEATVYVCQISVPDASPAATPFPEFRPRVADPEGPLVFLSAPFREPFTEHVLGQLTARGWPVAYGRVDERIGSAERQLGARIMKASIAVGTVIRPNVDFGLPWWTFQEIDFVRACGRPLALLVGGPLDHDPGLDVFPVVDQTIQEDFWRWLRAHSPVP